MQSRSLLTLPPEIILYILSFCAPKELLMLASVSKVTNKFANHNQIWAGLFTKMGGKINDKKDLSTQNYKMSYKLALENQLKLKDLQELARNLQELSPQQIGFIALFKSLVNLQTPTTLNSDALHGAIIFRFLKVFNLAGNHSHKETKKTSLKILTEYLKKIGITNASEACLPYLKAFQKYAQTLPDNFFSDLKLDKNSFLNAVQQLTIKLFPQTNEHEKLSRRPSMP